MEAVGQKSEDNSNEHKENGDNLILLPQVGHGAATDMPGDHFHDLVPLILRFHAVKKDARKNEGQHGSRWDEPK